MAHNNKRKDRMKINVLLNMDGVMCDFVRHACSKFPYVGDWKEVYENWPHNDYSLAHTFNQTAPGDFWKALDHEFWATMPKTEHADWLIGLLEDMDLDVCFLSTPSDYTGSASGKHEWIRTNYPDYNRAFLLGPAKRFCAHNRAILIDDNNQNWLDFKEAGGHAILFPQPWNILYSRIDQTREGITNSLNRIISEMKGKP